ncbi:MAG TPA: succinic semialdehyde dehydrogenase [Jiangellales bacterium]|nr:succinic semialdehyde dehydrogenase [Jiangellales bacterium]
MSASVVTRPSPVNSGAPGRRATSAPAVAARLLAALPEPADGRRATTIAPFTGEPLVDLPVLGPDDVRAAFARARRAAAGWRAVPVVERAAVLLRFHDLVLRRQHEVLDLVQWESGKARRHAFEEVGHAAVIARYYARTGPAALRPRRRAGLVPGYTHVVEYRHPKGVVGMISPWNYPLSPGTTDQFPAFVAGNAIVHKPDNQSALTALWVRELMVEAGLPADAWQVVLGRGSEIGSAMFDESDYVCFTGSTARGRQVAQEASARLIGVSLELGGKNAAIVLADANLDRAVEGLVRASFNSAGQMCVSMERVYVERAVYDDFAARFAARTNGLRLGPGFDWDIEMGSLANADQLRTVTAHVDDAVAKGATVLAGGRARPDLGPFFYEPTILSGVTDEMACAEEETFGPVVALYPVDSVDEAVSRANATSYGLNASLWTRDTRRARDLATRLQAGTVNVNEGYAASFGSIDAPMGGMNDSGLGRRNALEGLLKFTEPQTVAVQRGLALAPPGQLRYETFARAFTVMLKAMRKAGMR